MKVQVESGTDNGWGIEYHLRMLDGYHAGQLVCQFVGQPVSDINMQRLIDWAEEVGYNEK